MERRTFIRSAAVLGALPLIRPRRLHAAARPGDGRTEELLRDLVDAARDAGAEFAEARFLRHRTQTVQVRNANVNAATDTDDAGFALRVYRAGGWGFSAFSADRRVQAQRVAAGALEQASRAAGLRAMPAPAPGLAAEALPHWRTPGAQDPFDVPLREKVDFLLGLSRPPLDVAQIPATVANLFQLRKDLVLRNSLGGALSQERFITWPNFAVTAFHQGKRRADTRSSTIEAQGRGWEVTSLYNFASEGRTAVQEVMTLQASEPFKEGSMELVIDPTALWHILYETLGPALDPYAYAGVDGRRPGDAPTPAGSAGTRRLGSAALRLQYDLSLEGGLASSGWDDTGRAAASGVLIENGLLRALPGADDLVSPDQPWACRYAASAAWQAPPRFAMPNLLLGTGERSMADMIRDVGNGLLVKGRGRCFLNPSRTLFRYRPQLGWRIVDGVKQDMVCDFEIETSVEQFWNALIETGTLFERRTGGDFLPQNRNALWDAPFSVAVPPARFAAVPVYSTREARS